MSQSATNVRASASLPQSASPEAAPHVLIADHDPDSRADRQRYLSAAGFRVSVARTAFEAIVKASCHVPDLIVLDSSLGDMDATETRRLLTTCPVTAHIPVVQLAHGRRVPLRALTLALRA